MLAGLHTTTPHGQHLGELVRRLVPARAMIARSDTSAMAAEFAGPVTGDVAEERPFGNLSGIRPRPHRPVTGGAYLLACIMPA